MASPFSKPHYVSHEVASHTSLLRFLELRFDMPHLDLCPAGHKAGLKGGLKKVEKLVGISRPDEVDGLSGYEAVLLWQAHKGGDEAALDTLISYNKEDTANLHTLAWKVHERLALASGFPLKY